MANTNGKMITVVGSFVVGLTLRTDHMPIFGETLIGSDFDMGPGGKGSNQAVAAARLGVQTHFVGMIGQDSLGKIATDLYAQEGVNTQYLGKSQQMPTGVAFIILDHAGHNGIILDIAANKLMDEAYVNTAESQIAQSDIAMTVLEIPSRTAVHAMKLGRKHGVRTLMNPAPAVKLEDEAFQYIDYLTPNETELRILQGLAPDDPTPSLDLAWRLQKQGAKHIILTMGEKGALILTPDGVSEVAGLHVDVVDTTGAGDAFTAGLAVGLIEGKSLLEAVRFANCCGALACTKLGVVPALADRATADALYTKNYA